MSDNVVVRIRVDIKMLHQSLTRILGIEYIGPHEMSVLLGIDVRTAGKILSKMARLGLAVKWSRSFYKLIY